MLPTTIAYIFLTMITALSSTPTKIDCLIHLYHGIRYISDNLLFNNEEYGNISSIVDCAGYCVDENSICQGVTYHTKWHTCMLHSSSLNSSHSAKKYEKREQMVHASIICTIIPNKPSNSKEKGFSQSPETSHKPPTAGQSPKPSDDNLHLTKTPDNFGGSNAAKRPINITIHNDDSEENTPGPSCSLRFTEIGSNYFDVEITSNSERVTNFALSYQSTDTPVPSPSFSFQRNAQNRMIYTIRISGLRTRTTYLVSFSAMVDGEKKGFGTQMVKTLCGKPSQPPQNVKSITVLTLDANKFRLYWEAPPRYSWQCSSIGYVIKYKNSSQSYEVAVGREQYSEEVGTGTLYYEFHTKPSTLWEFQVCTQAINENGDRGECSVWSRSVERITNDYDFGHPGIPVAQPAVIKRSGPYFIEIEWDSVPDVRGYVIIYNVDGIAHTHIREIFVPASSSTKNSETLSNLELDTDYEIKIKVIDRSNQLGIPNSKTKAHTTCASPISPPDKIEIKSAPEGQQKLIWNAPLPDTWQCSKISYEVEFNDSSNNVTRIELPFETNEHIFLLSPDADWTSVKMRTMNTGWMAAGYSTWSQVVMAPGHITKLESDYSSSYAIGIKWNMALPTHTVTASYMITYTMVSVSDCSIPQNRRRTLVERTKDTTANLTNLFQAAKYEIKVRANFGTNKGLESQPITVQTKETWPSGPPLNIKVTVVSDTEVKITWDKPACFDRNGEIKEYEYVNSPVGQSYNWITIQTQSVSLYSLSASTSYNFLVKAKSDKTVPHESVEFSTTIPTFHGPNDFKAELQAPNKIAISFLPPTPPAGATNKEYQIKYKVVGDQHQWHEMTKAYDDASCADVGHAIASQRFCFQVEELEPNYYYIFQVAAVPNSGAPSAWSEYYYNSTSEPDVRIPLAGPKVRSCDERSATLYWLNFDKTKVMGIDILYKMKGTRQWTKAESIVEDRMDSCLFLVENLEEDTTYFFRFRINLDQHTTTLSRIAEGKTLCGTPTKPPEITGVTIHEFYTVRLTWKLPDRSTWKCSKVRVVIKYTSPTIQKEFAVHSNSITSYDFDSKLEAMWKFQMKVETFDEMGFSKDSSYWTRQVTIETKRPKLTYDYINSCNVVLYEDIKYTEHDSFGSSTEDSNVACVRKCIEYPSNNCSGVNFSPSSRICQYFSSSITSLEIAKGTFEAHTGAQHASITCDSHGTENNVFKCGRQAPQYEPILPIKHRIIGGTEAKPHSWPWQILLYKHYYYSTDAICGGSLIYPKYDSDSIDKTDIVLTAAHCVTSDDYARPSVLPPYKFSIAAGGHDKSIPSILSGDERREVSAIAVHDRFAYTDTIRPICLPAQGEAIPLGKTCMATGWGRDHVFTDTTPNTMHQTLLPPIAAYDCTWKYWPFSYKEDMMVCAGPLDGSTGTCSGDSGGVLACQQDDGSWTNYGVTSFGIKGCLAPNRPKVFARVSSYVDWIIAKARNMTSL